MDGMVSLADWERPMSIDALARALIQSAPSAVVALDTDGNVTMLNGHAEQLLDCSLESAIGMPYAHVLGTSLAHRLLGLFMRSIRDGDSTLPHLVRADLPSGRRVELRASTGPIRSDTGDVVGVLFVADEGGISGMAVGMQGLADDGAGPPIEDLCHVGAVFVAPGLWGKGLGGRLVDAVLSEARSRGYGRAQLWTHADNARAHRLYGGRGFLRTGREKADDLGETIVHYERVL